MLTLGYSFSVVGLAIVLMSAYYFLDISSIITPRQSLITDAQLTNLTNSLNRYNPLTFRPFLYAIQIQNDQSIQLISQQISNESGIDPITFFPINDISCNKRVYIHLNQHEFEPNHFLQIHVSHNAQLSDILAQIAPSTYPIQVLQSKHCSLRSVYLSENETPIFKSEIIDDNNVETFAKFGYTLPNLHLMMYFDLEACAEHAKDVATIVGIEYASRNSDEIIQCDDDGNCFNRMISNNLFGTQTHHALIRADISNVYKNNFDGIINLKVKDASVPPQLVPVGERKLRAMIPGEFIQEGVSTQQCLFDYGRRIGTGGEWMGAEVDTFVSAYLYGINIHTMHYQAGSAELLLGEATLSDEFEDVYSFQIYFEHYSEWNIRAYCHYNTYFKHNIEWKPTPNDINKASTLIRIWCVMNESCVYCYKPCGDICHYRLCNNRVHNSCVGWL